MNWDDKLSFTFFPSQLTGTWSGQGVIQSHCLDLSAKLRAYRAVKSQESDLMRFVAIYFMFNDKL